MKKTILILLTLIFITGCAELAVTKQAIKHGGAKVADDSLNTLLWRLCNATTYGAIKRKFGDNREKAEALKIICNGQVEADLVSG